MSEFIYLTQLICDDNVDVDELDSNRFSVISPDWPLIINDEACDSRKKKKSQSSKSSSY